MILRSIQVWTLLLSLSWVFSCREVEEKTKDVNNSKDMAIASKLFSSVDLQKVEQEFYPAANRVQDLSTGDLKTGWFVRTVCSDSNCIHFIKSSGLLIGQCLYSELYQTSFFINCGNNIASMRLYNGTHCQTPPQYTQYNLSASYQEGSLFHQYSCTSSVSSLQVPIGRSYVIYE